MTAAKVSAIRGRGEKMGGIRLRDTTKSTDDRVHGGIATRVGGAHSRMAHFRRATSACSIHTSISSHPTTCFVFLGLDMWGTWCVSIPSQDLRDVSILHRSRYHFGHLSLYHFSCAEAKDRACGRVSQKTNYVRGCARRSAEIFLCLPGCGSRFRAPRHRRNQWHEAAVRRHLLVGLRGLAGSVGRI